MDIFFCVEDGNQDWIIKYLLISMVFVVILFVIERKL